MKPGLLIIISLFAVSLSGQAATPSLENCAAIDDPVERLACYDRLSGRLPADTAKASDTAPGAVEPVAPKADVLVPAAPAMETKTDAIVPAAPVAPTTVPAVKPTPDAEAIFGLEHKQKPEEGRPDELRLKWTRKKKDAYGKWIIAMENGQVWHQTDNTRFIFRNSEQLVIISRGLAGGFFMRELDRKKRIRVTRVK